MLLTKSEARKFIDYENLSDKDKLLFEISDMDDEIYLSNYNNMSEKEKNNLAYYIKKNLMNYSKQEKRHKIYEYQNVVNKFTNFSDIVKRIGYFNSNSKNLDEFIKRLKLLFNLEIDDNIKKDIINKFKKEYIKTWVNNYFYNELKQESPEDFQFLEKTFNIHYV